MFFSFGREPRLRGDPKFSGLRGGTSRIGFGNLLGGQNPGQSYDSERGYFQLSFALKIVVVRPSHIIIKL